ncbi:MAG TPA: radical SAM protein [Terriglobales bacterium]|nr:radical SAM protein [Terriglobales bacterium]
MELTSILQAWCRILSGRAPSLSLEITRECPLRCPGCYAYEDAHLSGGTNLRSLADFKGEELITRVLALVDEHRPLHLSIVGGDPLVRYREMDVILPRLAERGIHVQVVTSAFRPISPSWASIPKLRVSVSVDGLQPEHDARRKPATYDKILRNIRGHHVAIHCTITSAMMQRPGYLGEFVAFWSANRDVEKIWMSIFTPQRGTHPVECLSNEQRRTVVKDLLELRGLYPKLNMSEEMVREYLTPPASPADCIFARTTLSISADLKTKIEPCQFGGDPDCSQCGCAASMGLAAIGRHKLVGPLTTAHVFQASSAVGRAWQYLTGNDVRSEPPPDPPTAEQQELIRIAS